MGAKRPAHVVGVSCAAPLAPGGVTMLWSPRGAGPVVSPRSWRGSRVPGHGPAPSHRRLQRGAGGGAGAAGGGAVAAVAAPAVRGHPGIRPVAAAEADAGLAVEPALP